MKRLLIALAAAALVGGCVKVDKTVPKDLPAFAQIYPGATSVVSMNIAGMSSIIFQAAATPDDVVGYYRTQATANGLVEVTATNNGPPEQKQATFHDPASNRIFVVIARPQNGGATVDLTYTPLKAAS